MLILQSGEEPVPGYRLKEFLGEGLFGKVWKARGPGDVSVALKFIDLGAKVGLKELRGVKRVKDIRDKNLLSIFGLWLLDHEGHVLGEDVLESLDPTKSAAAVDFHKTLAFSHSPLTPAVLVVAMQLADKTLSDRNKECKAEGQAGIPVKELLRYMEDAARGIDYLNEPIHDLGDDRLVSIRHCDVKPGNIVLVGRSAAVCDFGLARIQSDDIQRTTTGAAGTPAYMAPECIEKGEPSETSDQYALAVTYFELRTGELPFAAEDQSSAFSILRAHTDGRLMLSALPEAEQAVIRRATARLPDQRYPSCQEMVDELRRAVSGDMPPRPVRESQPITKDGSIAVERERDKAVMGTLIAPHKVFERDTDSEVAETLVTPLKSHEAAEARPAAEFATPRAAAPRRFQRSGLFFGGLVALAVACVVYLFVLSNREPAPRNDLELIRQIEEQIAAGQFDKARDGVSRLQDGQERAKLERLLLEAWCKAARERWTEGKPEVALSTIGRIRDHWPDDPTTLALRLEILNLLIDQAEDGLKPEQVDAAGLARIEQTLRSVVLGQLGEATGAGEPETARQAWLVLARTHARSENGIDQARNDLQEVARRKSPPKDLTESSEPQEIYFVALRSLLESKQTNRDRAAILQDLVALQPFADRLDPWERSQIGRLQSELLAELPPNASDDEARLAQILGENAAIEQKLTEANEHRKKGSFDDARSALAAAAKMADGNPIATAKVEVYRAMVALDDDTISGQQALVIFHEVAFAHVFPPSAELGDALERRVTRQPALVFEAVEKVKKLDGQPNFAALTPVYGRLLLLQIKVSLEAAAVADQELAAYYDRLKIFSAEAREHQPDDPVVNACLAECFVFENEKQLREGQLVDGWHDNEQRMQAAVKAIDLSPQDPLAAYVRYVRALVQFVNPITPDEAAAAEALRGIGDRLAASAEFRMPSRRLVSAKIMVAAARNRRSPNRGIDKRPFEPDAAEQTFQDLRLAAVWLEGITSPQGLLDELGELLALAAFWKPAPDLDVAIQHAEQALPALAGEDSADLLFVTAEAHRRRYEFRKNPADRDQAIVRYAELIKLTKEDQRGLVHFNQIFQPVAGILPLASTGDARIDRAAAELWAARGWLIIGDLEIQQLLRQSNESASQKGYHAFDVACQLNPQEPSYVVGKGNALIGLEPENETLWFEELESLANTALELDAPPSSHQTEGFGAYVAILKSRRMIDLDPRKSELDKAMRLYQSALAKTPPDKSRAVYLVGRSTAQVEFAAFTDARDVDTKRTMLKGAVQDATDATDIESRLREEDAWNARGNAVEDFALYLHEDEDANYALAIEHFKTALRLAKTNSRSGGKALLNLGRCQYFRVLARRAVDPGRELDMALRALTSAFEESLSRADTAEVQYWQSLIQLQKAGDQPTLESFQAAYEAAQASAKIAKEIHSLYWPTYQTNLANVTLRWALAATADRRLAPADKQPEQLRAEARAFAGELLDRADGLGFEVPPQYLHLAAVVSLGATDSLDDYVVETNRWLAAFSKTPTHPGFPYRIHLLLARAKQIVNAEHKANDWLKYKKSCVDDLDQVRSLVGDLPKDDDKSGFLADVTGVQGLVEFQNFANEVANVDAVKNAANSLREAVRQFDKLERALLKAEGPQQVDRSWLYRVRLAQANEWLIKSKKGQDISQLFDDGSNALAPITSKEQVGGDSKWWELVQRLKTFFAGKR